ncbi:hypothetical protein NDN08_007012 [Rhodosorus marinus]|uniref:Ferric oxidoreductase domain-containing protein n=1 Tax=Rhodosorus marinus TaxID=101924 RepID=A0AAV8UFC5_9RHOD|nr:hypothetical protein NDN08_007012 [Rhodosorus marinus]
MRKLVARIARTMGFEVIHMGAYWAVGPLERITYPIRSFLIVTGDVSAGLLATTFDCWVLEGFSWYGDASIPSVVWDVAGDSETAWTGRVRHRNPPRDHGCKGDEPTELKISSQLAPVFRTPAFLLFLVMPSCSSGTASGYFTWSEFRFIFVHVGYGVVGFTLAHVVCTGLGQIEDFHSSAGNTSPFSGEKALSAIVLVALLGVSILPKFIVSVPPMSTWVRKVRSHQKRDKQDLLPVWLRLSTSPSEADVNTNLDPDRADLVSQDSVS